MNPAIKQSMFHIVRLIRYITHIKITPVIKHTIQTMMNTTVFAYANIAVVPVAMMKKDPVMYLMYFTNE